MTTLTKQLARQACARGTSLAVMDDNIQWSWAKLSDASLRQSAFLRSKGLGQGDRVAILCSNRPAYLVAWFGIANLGAIAVSVNTGLVGDGLQYCLTQSGASAIVIERRLLAEKHHDLQALLHDLIVIVFDDEADMLAAAEEFEPDEPYSGQGADPVSIIYTSGTTGPPKGVLNCHEAFLACGRRMAHALHIVPEDRIMVFLPLFHTNPQMYAVMSALETGCTLVIRPQFSVSRFFDDARRFECTLFTYVGTVLSMLTSRLRSDIRDHSLTRCVGGGCPTAVWETMEERFGIKPYELYGMTEVGGWVTGNSTQDYRFGSCGKARPDVEVAIVDDQDQMRPPGQSGEIVVRPKEPFVFLLGYWNNPKASWDTVRNLWFHTGDIGSMDEEGYLFFQGRLKEIIRRGGENISPFEVEIPLLDHPDIRDAAVVGVPDDIYGEEIKAVIVASRAIPAESVRTFLTGRIPDYMMPRYIQFVEQIPRTETQKVQRFALQENTDGIVDLLVEH